VDSYLAEPALAASAMTMLDEILGTAQAPVIGVAGSSGKSTTARLLQAMLRCAGHRVSGDIETAYLRLDRLTSRDRIVLELPWHRLHVAYGLSMLVVPSMAADELPSGMQMSDAMQATRRVARRTLDAIVINADDARCLALGAMSQLPVLHASTADRGAAASLVEGTVWVSRNGVARAVCHIEDTSLAVGGLVTDLLVASAAAVHAGASVANIRRVASRHVARHGRHEVVGVTAGVSWINDATATRPGRTATSLSGYARPVTLVAGGVYGGQPLWRWAQVVASRASRVLLYDSGAYALTEALRAVGALDRVVRCADLEDAMDVAKRITSPGDTVVFSPGCEPGRDASPGLLFARLAATPDRRRVAA